MFTTWGALLEDLSPIYCQGIICISVVVLFASLVDTGEVVRHVHVHSFSIYVSVMGIAVMLYVLVSIQRYKDKVEVRINTEDKKVKLPYVTYDGEGMNAFLMTGTVVFGLGSLLLEALRLAMFAETSRAWICEGSAYFTATLFRLIFLLLILIFLMWQHKVVINFHSASVRFGFMHVIAGSIGMWATTVILESSHAFTNHDSNKPNDTAGKTDAQLKSEEVRVGNCLREATIYDEAGDYLFCFMIEFALLAATVMYKMHGTIGSFEPKRVEEKKKEEKKESCMEKIGGNKGVLMIVLGVVLFILTFSGAILFLVYEHGSSPNPHANSLIYLISDIILNVLAIGITIKSLLHIKRLAPISREEGFNIDEVLLSVSMFGLFFLLCFRLATETYFASFPGTEGTLAALRLVSSLVNVSQSFMQSAVIRDGLHRNAQEERQLKKKYGRRWLTALIMLNMAMWLVNTFELKEIYEGEIYQSLYGPLSWLIIVHVFLPLAILFRFHSAACLADVWLDAYEEGEDKTEEVRYEEVKNGEVNIEGYQGRTESRTSVYSETGV